MSRYALPNVSDFFAGYRDGAKLPPNIENLVEQVRIKNEAEFNARNRGSIAGVDGPSSYQELNRALDEQDYIASELSSQAERRDHECQIADRFEQLASKYYDLQMKQLAESLHECRQHGSVGIHEDGTRVFMWDHKCGQVRLCPDEAREEQQRINKKYSPLIESWNSRKPTRRLFFCVLTMPNERPGQLLNMKKRQFERFKKWMKQFDNIKGALVCQEDPLSANETWHVHLNVVLCVEGEFDYHAAHAAWCPQDDNGDISEHWQTDFHHIDGKKKTVKQSLLELVKYAVKPVSTKSADKAADGSTDAPGLADYPDHLLYEWWKAQVGFRRVRGYGCLYAAHRQRWDNGSYNDREAWWNVVRTMLDESEERDVTEAGDRSVLVSDWCDFSEGFKELLRRAMDEGLPPERGEVHWQGRVDFDRLMGRYDVGLITGNNFSGDGRAKDNFSRAGPVPLRH